MAVWETTDADETALDRYEGYPTFYYKTEMKLSVTGIKSGKVRERNVYVYIMHEDRPVGMPSSYYVQTCLEGYEAFGFDESFLFEAVDKSRRECHEE